MCPEDKMRRIHKLDYLVLMLQVIERNVKPGEISELDDLHLRPSFLSPRDKIVTVAKKIKENDSFWSKLPKIINGVQSQDLKEMFIEILNELE